MDMRRALLLLLLLFAYRDRACAQDLRVIEVRHFGALSVAFVGPELAASRSTGHNYLTLQDALASKKAVIHERNSQTLWIDNHSASDLFVQSGDLIKGGQQDRMIASDLILDPGDTTQDLTVFCIEQGRSTKRGEEPIETFSASDRSAPLPHLRAIAKHELTARLLVPHLGGLTAPDPEQLQMLEQLSALPVTSSPFVQSNDPAQLSVWRDVAQLQSGLTAALNDSVTRTQSPTSLQLALERAATSKRARSMEDDLFEDELNDEATGYVYAVGATIYGGDAYSSHQLFSRMWTKLGKALVAHSLSLPVTSGTCEADQFSDYIVQAKRGNEASERSNARTDVHVWETSRSYLFETRDTKLDSENGPWMHRQYVTK